MFNEYIQREDTAINAVTESTDYKRLDVLLAPLCKMRKTGTLIGVTAQRDSLAITLQSGVIVGMSVKNIVGSAALERLEASTECKSSFKDNLLLRTDTDLPDQKIVLKTLEIAELPDAPVPEHELAITVAKPTVSPIIAIIKAEASELFGPIAAMFVDNVIAGKSIDNADDLRAIIRELTETLGEPKHAATLIFRVVSKSGMTSRDPNRS